jgi:hypothetical protein
MDKLMIYPYGTDKPGVVFDVADGFVSRVVSAVAERNLPDAHRVAKLLNELPDDIRAGVRRAPDRKPLRRRAAREPAVRILETLALLVVGTWHALRPRRQRPAPENRTYPRPLPVAPEWAKPKERRPAPEVA